MFTTGRPRPFYVVSRGPRSTAADEIDDLDLIALADDGAVERRPFENHEVVFDGDAACVDIERRQQFTDRERTGKIEGIAVQSNRHGSDPSGSILSHIFATCFERGLDEFTTKT